MRPNYFDAQYNPHPVQTAALQQFLRKEEGMLVEYLWGSNAVFAVAIDGDKSRMFKIDKTEELVAAINAYTNELAIDPDLIPASTHFTTYVNAAFSIYEKLLLPVLPDPANKPTRLFISATGALATLPFEALISKRPDGEVNYHLPYLLRQYDISYTYAAKVLLDQSQHERHGNKLMAMGFAGDTRGLATRSSANNLPGTAQEVKAIKEVMKNGMNKYFLEDEATETVFKREVKDFNLAHLAMHGIGDTTNALQSRLIFRPGNDTVNDGNLYAHELYDLDLRNLDLAVLSACESGVGKMQQGEGVMSMARGFAYAGCPSIIISLWKINDNTTARLMSDFYKYLSQAERLDRALTRAKLDYLEASNEYNSHPAYWAAFLQMGNSKSIELKGSRILRYSIIFILILGFIIFLLRRLQYI